MGASNRQVAHAFAHQQRDRMSGSNFYFEGDTLFSYGRHFPVARHVTANDGKPAVLITTRSYSQSTSAHISHARSACSHLRVFYVYDVLAGSKADHKCNLAAMRERYESLILAASEARSRTDYWLRDAYRQLQYANEYAAAFKLGVRVKPADVGTIKARAERQAKRDRAERKRLDAERQACEEKRRAEYRQRVAQWLEDPSLSVSAIGYPPHGEPIRLRLIDDGETVETSAGARFPVADARRAWPLIKACGPDGNCRGMENPRGRLGDFKIDKIDEHGNVTAGCHVVTFAECKALAERLGLET